MSIEWSIFLSVAMLVGNAFFVGAEFALVSARRSNVELRAAKGSRLAKITLHGMERVSIMLAGAQLGVTLCSLIFGAVGEPMVAHLLEVPFAALGLDGAARHIVAFAIAIAMMVYLHVVIGEMVPKNLALASPTRAALVLVPILFYAVKLTRPIISALNAVANATLHAMGIEPRDEIASAFNRDEVIGFVKESHREGLLSAEEEQLLSSSLVFDHQTIMPIVINVNSIIAAGPKPTVDELEALVVRTGYSRFPVRNTHGGLKGYVHIKDLLHLEQGERVESKIRSLPTISSGASARRALAVMQSSGAHIAQVTNTRNKLVGVVMLEDVLEQLVGTIRDSMQKKQLY